MRSNGAIRVHQRVAKFTFDTLIIYHFTTKTLTNSSQMSSSSKPQMIMLFGDKMLVISDSGEILLDNHVYRMGYSGGKDAKKMMKSINKILKSE